MTFEFAPQKQERKGGWEPIFASNFTLNFRVLIRPHWPGQVHSIIKDIKLKLCYQNQNVRGRQGLKKWQGLILFTVRNSYERRHANFIHPWVFTVIHRIVKKLPKKITLDMSLIFALHSVLSAWKHLGKCAVLSDLRKTKGHRRTPIWFQWVMLSISLH